MTNRGGLTETEWGEWLACDFFNTHAGWFAGHIVRDNQRDYGRFLRLREGEFGSPPDIDPDRKLVWETLRAMPVDLAWSVTVGELLYPWQELADFSQSRIDGCRMLAKLSSTEEETRRAFEGDFERIGKYAIGAIWIWGLQPNSWELPGGPGQLYRLDLMDCHRKSPGCADLLPDPYAMLVEALTERFTIDQRESLFDVIRGRKPVRNHRELFRTVGRMAVDLWELPDPRTEHKVVCRSESAQTTSHEPQIIYCVGGK